MRASVICLLAALVLLAALPQSSPAQATMPSIRTVEPAAGKAGDTIKAVGENLDKKNVTQLFLTDGKNDLPCQISEQTATSISFKIPASAKSMRYSVAVLTPGKEPKFIEQPVKLQVQ